MTDVESFVHYGVLGEILVIDRNGRLASYDVDSGELASTLIIAPLTVCAVTLPLIRRKRRNN